MGSERKQPEKPFTSFPYPSPEPDLVSKIAEPKFRPSLNNLPNEAKVIVLPEDCFVPDDLELANTAYTVGEIGRGGSGTVLQVHS